MMQMIREDNFRGESEMINVIEIKQESAYTASKMPDNIRSHHL
jgi:hypothetical protein